MLHDLFRSSSLLSKAPKIERAYMCQTTVLIMECRKLSSTVKNQVEIQHAARAITSLSNALDHIASFSSKKGATKEAKEAAFRACIHEVQFVTKEIFGSECLAQFNSELSEAKIKDDRAARRLEERNASLRLKFALMESTLKFYIEFCVWDPYLPPTTFEPDKVQKHVKSRMLMVFEENTILATALVYFVRTLRNSERFNPKDWICSLENNSLFYIKFPVDHNDFFVNGNHRFIPPLPLLDSIGDLVTTARMGYTNIGKNTAKPLPVHVLADRRTCVFFELSKGIVITFGNIFKFKSDGENKDKGESFIVLRDKTGKLVTPKILQKEFAMDLASSDAQTWPASQSNRQETPEVVKLHDMFDAIAEAVKRESDDEFHWRSKLVKYAPHALVTAPLQEAPIKNATGQQAVSGLSSTYPSASPSSPVATRFNASPSIGLLPNHPYGQTAGGYGSRSTSREPTAVGNNWVKNTVLSSEQHEQPDQPTFSPFKAPAGTASTERPSFPTPLVPIGGSTEANVSTPTLVAAVPPFRTKGAYEQPAGPTASSLYPPNSGGPPAAQTPSDQSTTRKVTTQTPSKSSPVTPSRLSAPDERSAPLESPTPPAPGRPTDSTLSANPSRTAMPMGNANYRAFAPSVMAPKRDHQATSSAPSMLSVEGRFQAGSSTNMKVSGDGLAVAMPDQPTYAYKPAVPTRPPPPTVPAPPPPKSGWFSRLKQKVYGKP